MGLLKPIRTIDDRIRVGELIDTTKPVCTNPIKPLFCNNTNKKIKK